jgi:hypothetical protein
MKRIVHGAWMTAYLHRVKRFPNLKEVLPVSKAATAQDKTRAGFIAAMRAKFTQHNQNLKSKGENDG